ncbi:MAG: hemerythrin domain-containing protein [Chromatiaceae bacterium]
MKEETATMPESIAETLAADHRRCDRLLAQVEIRAGRSDWEGAASDASALEQAMDQHLRFEEESLFPPLEQARPMAKGPTGVMRMEHAQIRQLLGDLIAATEARDRDDCLGLLETLHLVIQQHNAKEEAILYPMADAALGSQAPALLARLAGH